MMSMGRRKSGARIQVRGYSYSIFSSVLWGKRIGAWYWVTRYGSELERLKSMGLYDGCVQLTSA